MELTPREVMAKLAELDELQRSWNKSLAEAAQSRRPEIEKSES
jgi:hypothetical protein